MKKSYYKDGQLFEMFNCYHHKWAKVRNRTEAFMIEFIKGFLDEPVNHTIESLRALFIYKLNNYMENNKTHGACSFSEIHNGGSIIGHPNWVNRQFELFATGRGTATISITDHIMKDSGNGFAVVAPEELVYNKHLLETNEFNYAGDH